MRRITEGAPVPLVVVKNALRPFGPIRWSRRYFSATVFPSKSFQNSTVHQSWRRFVLRRKTPTGERNMGVFALKCGQMNKALQRHYAPLDAGISNKGSHLFDTTGVIRRRARERCR